MANAKESGGIGEIGVTKSVDDENDENDESPKNGWDSYIHAIGVNDHENDCGSGVVSDEEL